jgi:hypothetical protein
MISLSVFSAFRELQLCNTLTKIKFDRLKSINIYKGQNAREPIECLNLIIMLSSFRHGPSKQPPNRKNRFFWRKQIPEEHHKSVEAFLRFFPYRNDYIYRALQPNDTEDTWFTAKDSHWQLADSSILKAICFKQLDKIYGCRFDKWTRFAVIDIDAAGAYHNLESIDKLRLVLRKAGLKCVLYQSSQSGGWHLYLPFGQRRT